jgi:hypothetical protein
VAGYLVQRGFERLAVLGAKRFDGPVLLRGEGADVALPLDDEPERHGLYPACRQTGLDGVPENGAGLVAHQPIENSTGLLGIDLSIVDLARLAQRRLDGVPGYLVEQNAVGGCRRVELTGDMPGYRFAFAVRVGGQVDGGCALGGLLQLGQGLRFAFDRHVLGLKPAVHVHPQLAGR